MTKNDIKEIRKIISGKPDTVILTHFNPDGDAIGSALAAYHYLRDAGCRATAVIPDAMPAYLKWMPASDRIVIARDAPARVKKLISSAKFIFCVDFNQLKRLMGHEEYVRQSSAPKILIDHHQSPEPFVKYLWSEPAACSSAELVFKFFRTLNPKGRLSQKILDCLYTGVLTDSMGFRIGNANAQTHQIVSDLITLGARYHRIHNQVYDTNTLDRLRLIGYCLSEKLKVFPEFATAIISLSRAELERFNYQVGDTEGVVNYALSIVGVHLAVFIVERKSHVKLSFRSKNNFPVHEFAKKHFNGGGHFHAAGGETNITLDETIDLAVSLLPQYKSQLVFMDS